MSQSLITNEAVNCAIDYILQHIHERLSVDDVAAHCHFSKYHFSRMFKEETGESVYGKNKAVEIGAECIPHEGGARAHSDGYRL